jgi:tetratricopeptide (TPR) repeat protein
LEPLSQVQSGSAARTWGFDVFLSHNAKDKSRVGELAEQLQVAGLRIWFDDWIIKPGDDIYLTIERGLESSRVLVLCLSQAAVGSDWVGLERSTVLFRDPANTSRRFLPLLLEDCELPDTLRRYKYVDYRKPSQAAIVQLVTACSDTVDQDRGLSGAPGTRISVSAQTVDDLYNLGIRCLQDQNYDGALDALNQTIALDPYLAYAFYNRALAYYYKRDDNRALEDFNKALELGFNTSLLFRNRANAYSRKGNVANALADYDRAIGLEPENPLAYLNRGEVYENTLQKKLAIADYREVLRLYAEPQLKEAARERLLRMGVKPR